MLNRRILWILNHDTLSKFELPLIRDLGFEVYTPKCVPKEILQQSGSVTFDYDHTLTIPKEDLDVLNKYNFYENKRMPFHIRSIINRYFDIAIVMYNFYAINNIVNYFDGIILTRAFGLGGDIKYYDITKSYSENLLYKMNQIKDRFWFSHCYESITDNEIGIYQEKSLFMPLGLPSDFYEIEDEWNGELNKVMFFCSRIKIFEESERTYNKFIKDFSGFDYVIVGNQPVPVDDINVTGFLERHELNDYYKKCKVMYYHSTYPRHVHYHPLEAIVAGMPVVYMDGGLLSSLGGKRQRGCCKDINEARNKIKRILDGDTQLVEDIKEDQKEILYKFSYQYNRRQWETNFLPIIENNPLMKTNKAKTLALFVTDEHAKYYVNDYKEVARVFSEGLTQINHANKAIFNVPINKFDVNIEFSDLYEAGVSVREYSLEKVDMKHVKDSLDLMLKDEVLWHSEYIIPVDYAHNYVEADYWLFLNDNIEQPIAPIKPYGIYVEDLGERFYGNISEVCISNYKNAYFILTGSERTKCDLVKHLGIKEEKIKIVPMIHSKTKYDIHICAQREDHVLIEVDLKKMNSINNVLKEIREYHQLYRNDKQIRLHINNSKFDNHEELVNQISSFIQGSKYMKNNVTIHFDTEVNEYDTLYLHAEKIIVPHHVSNIYYKLVKAASFSKRVVLNDFPLYKVYEQELGYNFEYKNFFLKKNVLIDVLVDSSPYIITNKESHPASKSLSTEVSQVWRNIL